MAIPANVFSVEESDGEKELILQFSNGSIEFWNLPEEMSASSGDVAIVDDDGIERILSSQDDTNKTIGVIEKELEGGNFIVNNGSSLDKVTSNLRGLKKGNTVQYDQDYQITTLIDEEPIRAISKNHVDISEFIKDLKFDLSDSELTINDFGGLNDRLRVFKQEIEVLLEEREKYEDLGGKPHAGALFRGPPGTGKTLFARILASEMDATFYRIRGPEIVTKGYGDTEKILRELFQDAEEEEKAIIFFDEIDSIGREREEGVNKEFGNKMVAQLLSLIDGVEKGDGSRIVIGSTNRYDKIDEALTRSGRLDIELEFNIPDSESRKDILEVVSEDYELANGIKLDRFAEKMEGWSGADIKRLLEESVRICAINDEDKIHEEHLIKGFQRVNREVERDVS